jgi:predicted GIY-YIG superfamily endonuclease
MVVQAYLKNISRKWKGELVEMKNVTHTPATKPA